MPDIVQRDRLVRARLLAFDASFEVRDAAVLLHHRHAQLVALGIERPQRPGRAGRLALSAEIAVPFVEVEHGGASLQQPILHMRYPHHVRRACRATAVALHACSHQRAFVLAARRSQQPALAREGDRRGAHARERGRGGGESQKGSPCVVSHTLALLSSSNPGAARYGARGISGYNANPK